MVDCLADRVVEVVQPLPGQSPVEGSTNIGAGQPEFDVIRLVYHRVLHAFRFSFQSISADEKETHPGHCEDDADGAKNNLGGRDA